MPMLIADLLQQGIRLQSHEAVAIAQQLIHNRTAAALRAPLGPPSIDNVQLLEDGSVACLGCEVTPSTFEIAVLLEALLPSGMGQIQGGLRYAIARALLEVDAPPFDSIEDFSRTLARFERGDRRAAVRGVIRRVPVRLSPRMSPVPVLASSTAARPQFEPDFMHTSAAPGQINLQPAHTSFDVAETKRAWTWLPAAAALFFGTIAVTGVLQMIQVGSTRAPAVGGGSQPTSIARASTEPAARGSATTNGDNRSRAVAPVPAPATAAAKSGTGSIDVATDGRRASAASENGLTLESRRRPMVARVRTSPAPADGELVAALDGQQRPVFSPAFASNGSAMFFHTGRTADAHSALATAEAPETTAVDLEVMTILDDGARNYHVQPSPDGRSIAFDSDRDGERGVYVADRNGTNVRRISGDGYAAVPTWAPDGRRLTYVRAEAGNPKVWNLWVQPLDKGAEAAKRLTSYRFGQPWSASWFPDNRRVCYTHEDRIVILDVETGRSQEYESPVKGRLVRTPAVSPDGSKVIFQLFRQGAWILDLADGSMMCVLTDPTAEEFAWAPDGRRVAFHSRRDGQWGIFILHRG